MLEDLVFVFGAGLYLLGGLAIVALFLAIDHRIVTRRIAAAQAEMRTRDDLERERVFGSELGDDWRGFPA